MTVDLDGIIKGQGIVKGPGILNIVADVFDVNRKWQYFKNYIEITLVMPMAGLKPFERVLKKPELVKTYLAYRFPFKEPLVDFDELPEISEDEYDKYWQEYWEKEAKSKKRKRLNKNHPIDWYGYFLALEKQKVTITLAYREFKKGKKTIIEIVSIHSNSGPVVARLNM